MSVPRILALALATVIFAPIVALAGVVQVDCDGGDSLGAAVGAASPGDTILVSGTCNETVTVRTDELTIDGQGTAAIDGGGGGTVVLVDGARRLAMQNLTVRNGSGGILARNNATLTLTDLDVTGNASHGIEVIHSIIEAVRVTSEQNGRVGLIVNRNTLAEVTDASLRYNDISGLVVYSNAVVRFFGTNDMSSNGGQGMTVALGGAIFSIGPALLLNDNGAEGLFISQQGNVQAVGGTLEATGNAGDGIHVDQNSSLSLGLAGLGSPPQTDTSNNARHGVAVERSSHLLVTGDLTSIGNGAAGLFVHDQANATVEGAIVGLNGTADMWISFGSQVTAAGNLMETVFCDRRTALVLRGDERCTHRITEPE